jgi:hypothetical protein
MWEYRLSSILPGSLKSITQISRGRSRAFTELCRLIRKGALGALSVTR